MSVTLPKIEEIEHSAFKYITRDLKEWITHTPSVNLTGKRNEFGQFIAKLRDCLRNKDSFFEPPTPLQELGKGPQQYVIDNNSYPEVDKFYDRLNTERFKIEQKHRSIGKAPKSIRKKFRALEAQLREDIETTFLKVSSESDRASYFKSLNDIQEWEQRIKQHKQKEKQYKRDLKIYNDWVERGINPLTRTGIVSELFNHKILDKLEADFNNKIDGKTSIQTKKLYWELLPRGKISSELITEIISRYTGSKRKTLDESRILFALSLNPSEIYIGQNEFTGYFVFLYPWTSKALLENPFSGNAAYILNQAWMTLSRIPKSELLNKHKNAITRIIHFGDITKWKFAIKDALQKNPAQIQP